MVSRPCTHCGKPIEKTEDTYKQYGICASCYEIPEVLESRRYQLKEGKRADPHKVQALIEKANSLRKSK